MDFINRKHNFFGLASAALSFLIDMLSNVHNLGTFISLFITLSIGLFSVLRAYESWQKDRDERLYLKRVRNAKYKQEQEQDVDSKI